MNKALRTSGTVTKNPAFMSLESQKEEKEDIPAKVIKKILAENFPIWQKT